MPVGASAERARSWRRSRRSAPSTRRARVGNPVAVAAGLATLALTEADGFYESLAARTRAMTEGVEAAARRAGVTFCADAVGGMFGIYFTERVPTSYAEVMACDKERFNRFFHAMLDAGVYLAPSAFEAGFVSSAHGEAEIAAKIEAAEKAFHAFDSSRCPVQRPAIDPPRPLADRRRRDARRAQAARGDRAHRARMDAAVHVWSAADGLVHRTFAWRETRDDTRWGVAEGYQAKPAQPAPNLHAIEGTQDLRRALAHIDGKGEAGVYVLCDAHPFLDDPSCADAARSHCITRTSDARRHALAAARAASELKRLASRLTVPVPIAPASATSSSRAGFVCDAIG